MRIRESRALFGAIALMITGAILSSMGYQYFAGEYTGEAIVRSRSWWEVVLNLQVLCLAFMWFCYADRVRGADKSRAFVMRLRMIFGLLSVSVPFGLAIISVFLGWFETRPSMEVVDLIVCYLLGFWLVSTALPRLISLRNEGQTLTWRNVVKRLQPRSVWFTLPAAGGLILLFMDVTFNVQGYYYLIPTFFYLQAAMPFLDKALGLSRVPATPSQPAEEGAAR